MPRIVQKVTGELHRKVDNFDESISDVVEIVVDPIGDHNSGLNISTVQTLTPPSGATKLLIQALVQNARYTIGGVTPTTTVGFQLKAGDPPIIIPLGNRTIIKVIEESGGCSLQYQFAD